MRNRVSELAWALLLLPLLTSTTPAQLRSQTLPAGLMNADGNSASLALAYSGIRHWQWHYDSAEFQASGPIQIREVWVRLGSPSSSTSAYSYPSFDVTLMEAATDYRPTSHSPLFDNNDRRSDIVRRGPLDGAAVPASGSVAGDWIPLRLQSGFIYDPTTGRDFIIDIESCGTNDGFDALIDAVSNTASMPGTDVGGNSYYAASCNAIIEDSHFDQNVPVVRIDYVEVSSQTLPSGLDATLGGAATSFPFDTTAEQVWQWHYDASEFAAQGPIAITEVSVRALSGGPAAPFSFSSFEVTLIEASTGYAVGFHHQAFVGNVARARVVRTGAWSGRAVSPSLTVPHKWVAFGLEDTFVFDPTRGRDFIVQLRTCGSGNSPWGATADGVAGSGIGGNRYGHTSDCSAITQNFNNDEFVPVVKIDFLPVTVSTYPFEEDFDSAREPTSAPVGWHQGDLDDDDWRFRTDSTQITSTGPPADHTTRIEGAGRYAYIEDPSFNEAATINLVSPLFDLSPLTAPKLSFWFHSFDAFGGGSTNAVAIDVLLGSGGVVANAFQPIVHSNADDWEQRVVDLGAFAGGTVAIRFRGRNDNGLYGHEIALDDVRVSDFSPSSGQAARPGTATMNVNESFNVNGLGTGLAAPGPYYTDAPAGGVIWLRVDGPASSPIMVFTGPLNEGVASFGPIGQLDLGTPGPGGGISGLSTIADGNSTTFPDILFRTDAAGEFAYSYPTPVGLLGFSFALQGLTFGTPTAVSLTNAVLTTITP